MKCFHIYLAVVVFLWTNLLTHEAELIAEVDATERALESDRRSAQAQCELQSNCGGLLFETVPPNISTAIDAAANMRNSTASETKPQLKVTKILAVPTSLDSRNAEVFVSSKSWLIQRGAVDVPVSSIVPTNILWTATNMSIEEARQWCRAHDTCVAFSFPLQSERHLFTVDEVIFVDNIAGFHVLRDEHGPNGQDMLLKPAVEWITHIDHNRTKLTGRLDEKLDVDRWKWSENSKTPYRPCCQESSLPTIDEIRALDTIERIPCNVSREEFFEKYEKTKTPVVLVGCDAHWPARQRWSSVEKLLDRFDNDSIWDAGAGELMSWGRFREWYASGKEYHIFDQLKDTTYYKASLILGDFEVPAPFRDVDLFHTLGKRRSGFPPGYGNMTWFVVGAKHTGTHPHVDPYATDAWNALVTGYKWWVIFPKSPTTITETEISCFDSCSSHLEERDWYASVGRHAHKFYYGDGRVAKHCLHGPGETIYVPFGMVHSVLNMEETIAITQNYGAPGNFEDVWIEVLKHGEKYDWQHMYYSELDKALRKRARQLLWPITKDGASKFDDRKHWYE